jgi:ATP-dependent DNA helicase RecQ
MTSIKLTESLKTFFGYNEFRAYQAEIIEHILEKKDLLAILPTGFGKSLCYQLPAVLSPGTAIVISPLISLMQDQVDSLNKIGIKAAFVNSSLDKYDLVHILQNLNAYKLIYIAPERFSDTNFVNILTRTNISFFVIDEAHCISQWGHSFRPDYRQLSRLKKEFPDIPVTAFTATATLDVSKDIKKQLLMQNPKYIRGSFDRPNLTMRINDKIDEKKQLLDFLARNKEKSGIIYTSTRKSVDKTYESLKKHGYSIAKYHAGMTEIQRSKAQREFIKDDVKIIVATIAFGMGIHKPDVRFILHLNMPKNIEQYYQEIGRAGRDGLAAECLMLFSTRDLILQKKRSQEISNSFMQQQLSLKTEQIFTLCSSINCRRTEILNYFGENYGNDKCNNCDNCLDKTENIDGTIISQKILSCVYRLKQNFGINYVTDVLYGAKTQAILQRNHDKLSTYKLMSEYPKLETRYYIFSLINMGYLRISDGEYPVLKLTDKSKEILFEKKELQFRKKVFKASKAKINIEVNYDHILFEKLSLLRKQIATQAQVAPYIIFADKPLLEMATYFPQTKEQFLQINGVGQEKLKQYGDIFLTWIKAYCKEKNIKPHNYDSQTIKPKSNKNKTSSNATLIKTIELFRENKSIEEIAQIRGLSPITVSKHIATLIEKGENIDIYSLIPKEKFAIIQAAINDLDTQFLSPIKNQVGEDYSWDEIRFVVAFHKKNQTHQ